MWGPPSIRYLGAVSGAWARLPRLLFCPITIHATLNIWPYRRWQHLNFPTLL